MATQEEPSADVEQRLAATAAGALNPPPSLTFDEAFDLARNQLHVYKRSPDESAMRLANEYGFDLELARAAVRAVEAEDAILARRFKRRMIGLTVGVIAATAVWHVAFGARAGAYLMAFIAIVGGNIWMLALRRSVKSL